jgi:chemotaxis protein CheD
MNHSFLPGDPYLESYDGSARFGINAMELLINGIMNLGGQRPRLVAKVFGGAHILRPLLRASSTGATNVRFVDAFLERESIPVLARDVGGSDTRVLQFHTDTGAVLLRRLRASHQDAVVDAEARYGRKVREAMGRDADVTWFR